MTAHCMPYQSTSGPAMETIRVNVLVIVLKLVEFYKSVRYKKQNGINDQICEESTS